jgi:uncharacterized protein
MSFKTIRDPLWNNIRVEPFALRLIDTAVFQRLRYVRQLGLAYLVYPGATHSRFEHALGAYHLARQSLALLAESEPSLGDGSIARAAMLLHDVGHYPFSHALEEIGFPLHEDVARDLVTRGEIADILRSALGTDAPERVLALIKGTSDSPLQGLVAGSLDLDKIEYLKRDAFMCGVPYGQIDVDRLLHSMVLVPDPATGRPTVGVLEKGLAALESLLFAKYQMYRNVYWHHAVRSATAMYKRLIIDATTRGHVDPATIMGRTDDSLLDHIAAAARPVPALLTALRARRLYKRALECPSAELSPSPEWIAADARRTVAVEDRLAAEHGLAPGELLLDFPAKTQMLALDVPILARSGTVRRLSDGGWESAINLPSLSAELYASARWLRIFVARPVAIDRDAVLAMLTTGARIDQRTDHQ